MARASRSTSTGPRAMKTAASGGFHAAAGGVGVHLLAPRNCRADGSVTPGMADGLDLVRNGYVFAVAETRGRGASFGTRSCARRPCRRRAMRTTSPNGWRPSPGATATSACMAALRWAHAAFRRALPAPAPQGVVPRAHRIRPLRWLASRRHSRQSRDQLQQGDDFRRQRPGGTGAPAARGRGCRRQPAAAGLRGARRQCAGR